jgi:hypothetical protein
MKKSETLKSKILKKKQMTEKNKQKELEPIETDLA